MENGLRYLRIITVTVVLLSAPLAGSLLAQTEPSFKPDTGRLTWNRLSFAARKVLGTVTTEIHWQDSAAEEIEKILIPVSRQGALQSTGGKILRLEGRSVVKPLWGSEDVFKTLAWYDSVDGAALQRTRWRQGRENWEKTYRFAAGGVSRLRKRPGSKDEIDGAPARWSDIEESFYPYPLDRTACTRIVEPLALLIYISALDPASTRPAIRLCVFNKKQLHQVQIEKAGIKRMPVDYVQQLEEGPVRRQGRVEVQQYAIRSRLLAAGSTEAEPFSFLGLKGDFDVYVDRISKIPVQVSGNISGFGEVNFKLVNTERN